MTRQARKSEGGRERLALRSRWDALQTRYAPYWLLLPAVAVIGAVLLYPLGHALYISVLDYKLARSARPFVGLGNYVEAVTSASFGAVLAQNIIFAVVCIGVEFTIAMGTALLLHRKFRGRALYRVFLLLPMLTAPVLAGFNWRWIFNDRFGLMNQIFIAVGLPPQGWLVDPNLARLAIVIATVWQGIPFVMILLLAGLQALPQTPFEAATVDGATAWQRFALLTMPLMRPVIAVALALRIIDLFRVFDVIYIMTLGGPGHATELLPFYIYRAAFSQSQFGLASALSWITVFITIVLLIPLFLNERSGAESEKLN